MPPSSPERTGDSGAAASMNQYLITGATGGVGGLLVRWLLEKQELQPSQLVLLTRKPTSPFKGVRVVQLQVLAFSFRRGRGKLTPSRTGTS